MGANRYEAFWVIAPKVTSFAQVYFYYFFAGLHNAFTTHSQRQRVDYIRTHNSSDDAIARDVTRASDGCQLPTLEFDQKLLSGDFILQTGSQLSGRSYQY